MTQHIETVTPRLVQVASDRRVAVHEISGDGDRAVLMFHPAPGAGLFDPDPEQTAGRGVTLIEIDRPGYGDSDPLDTDTWATVSSAAEDAAAVVDERGLRSIGVVGWSAGGRVALALAAKRPDLIDRVVVVGTPAPHEQVPWMPDEVSAAVDALRGMPPAAVHEAMSEQLSGFAATVSDDPNAGLAMLGGSDADSAVLANPGAAGRIGSLVTAALAQGTTGLVSDMAGYTLQPWGFEPHDVHAKTLLLYGSADPIAGSSHGRWWQRQLPNARLEMVPGAGHLLIVPMWKRVLAHLAPHRK
jgi:pimeloyl-ACP methyl ester carboxylesterase